MISNTSRVDELSGGRRASGVTVGWGSASGHTAGTAEHGGERSAWHRGGAVPASSSAFVDRLLRVLRIRRRLRARARARCEGVRRMIVSSGRGCRVPPRSPGELCRCARQIAVAAKSLWPPCDRGRPHERIGQLIHVAIGHRQINGSLPEVHHEKTSNLGSPPAAQSVPA